MSRAIVIRLNHKFVATLSPEELADLIDRVKAEMVRQGVCLKDAEVIVERV
jgi:hypothetical protein